MTELEFIKKCEYLRNKYLEDIEKLKEQFFKDNIPYKVGDIVFRKIYGKEEHFYIDKIYMKKLIGQKFDFPNLGGSKHSTYIDGRLIDENGIFIKFMGKYSDTSCNVEDIKGFSNRILKENP